MLSVILAGRGYLILILKGVPDQDPDSAAMLWLKCGIWDAMNFAEKCVFSKLNWHPLPHSQADNRIEVWGWVGTECQWVKDYGPFLPCTSVINVEAWLCCYQDWQCTMPNAPSIVEAWWEEEAGPFFLCQSNRGYGDQPALRQLCFELFIKAEKNLMEGHCRSYLLTCVPIPSMSLGLF